MLIKYLSAYKLHILAILPILLLVLIWPYYGWPVQTESADMPILWLADNTIGKLLQMDSFIPAFIVYYLLLFSQIVLLINLQNIYSLLNRQTYLHALIFIIVVSIFRPQNLLHEALPASLFVLMGLARFFSTYRHENALKPVFEAAALFSMATLFYISAIYFVILFIIMLIVVRDFSGLRETAALILGFLLPYYLLFALFFLITGQVYQPWENIQQAIVNWKVLPELKWQFWQFFATTMVLVLLFTYQYLRTRSKKISIRKYFIIFFYLFFISLAMFFFVPTAGGEVIYFIAIPLSFILGHYWLNVTKNWHADVVFLLFIVSRVLCEL